MEMTSAEFCRVHKVLVAMIGILYVKYELAPPPACGSLTED